MIFKNCKKFYPTHQNWLSQILNPSVLSIKVWQHVETCVTTDDSVKFVKEVYYIEHNRADEERSRFEQTPHVIVYFGRWNNTSGNFDSFSFVSAFVKQEWHEAVTMRISTELDACFHVFTTDEFSLQLDVKKLRKDTKKFSIYEYLKEYQCSRLCIGCQGFVVCFKFLFSVFSKYCISVTFTCEFFYLFVAIQIWLFSWPTSIHIIQVPSKIILTKSRRNQKY